MTTMQSSTYSSLPLTSHKFISHLKTDNFLKRVRQVSNEVNQLTKFSFFKVKIIQKCLYSDGRLLYKNCCIRKMVFPWKYESFLKNVFLYHFERWIFREEMWCRICFNVALWPARCFYLSKSKFSKKNLTSQTDLRTFILLSIQL